MCARYNGRFRITRYPFSRPISNRAKPATSQPSAPSSLSTRSAPSSNSRPVANRNVWYCHLLVEALGASVILFSLFSCSVTRAADFQIENGRSPATSGTALRGRIPIGRYALLFARARRHTFLRLGPPNRRSGRRIQASHGRLRNKRVAPDSAECLAEAWIGRAFLLEPTQVVLVV